MAGSWDSILRVAFRQIDDARERLSSPEVRFELRRKAFHVAGAVVAVPVLLLLPFWWALGVGAAVVAVLVVAYFVRERRLTRRRGPQRGAPASTQAAGLAMDAVEALTDPIGEAIVRTRRPGETFPWAPVSFTLALIGVGVLVEFAGLPLSFAFAAYGILGFGDAASALVGVAYGAHKLPWNRRKSVEGTVAGAAAGFLAAVVLGSLHHAWIGEVLHAALFVAFFASAVAGALIETLPRVQDNWAVPLGSLAVMAAIGRLLGVA